MLWPAILASAPPWTEFETEFGGDHYLNRRMGSKRLAYEFFILRTGVRFSSVKNE